MIIIKTIVEALKDLYVAIGGNKSDIANDSLNPDVIEDIATLITGGALKELPAVSGSDDGDVLTVVDGKWNKAQPSGGGEEMLSVVFSQVSGDTYTCDKTFDEIKAFYVAHGNDVKKIKGYYDDQSFYLGYFESTMSSYWTEGTEEAFSFYFLYTAEVEAGTPWLVRLLYWIANDGTVDVAAENYTLTKAV